MELPQVSFGKGEVSPIAAARTDSSFYQNGVGLLQNFFVRAEGGISNRPGLQFIGNSLSNTPNGSYLLPFIFNNEQTYVTEFSAGTIQLYSQGAFVQNAVGVTITNVTVSNGPLGVTATITATNTFTVGQQVTISGVTYTGTANPNVTSTVQSATGAQFTCVIAGYLGTFTYVSGGTATTNLNLTNPYALADLPNLRWAQSADTLNIVVSTQPLYQLKRVTVNSFTFVAPTLLFGPFQDINTDGTTTVYASATQGTVTLTASSGIFKASHVGTLFSLQEQFLGSIQPWEAEKILVSTGSPVGTYCRSDGKIYVCVGYNNPTSQTTIATGTFQPVHTAGTQADGNGMNIASLGAAGVLWQFVSTDVGIAQITQYISPTQVLAVVQSYKGIYANFPPTTVGGPQSVHGPYTFSGNGSTTTFSPLSGATTADPNQFYVTIGGIFQDPSTFVINGSSIVFYTPPVTGTNNIVVEQVTGTLKNNLNGTSSNMQGLCLSTYWAFGSISAVQGYPSEVCYFDDRLVLAGTTLQPQTFFTSKVSDYLNFGVSDPQVDSDAITETINSRQQNPINNLLPMNNLLLGTASASWRVTNSTGIGSITPSNIDVIPQEFYGMQPVPAVQTGTTILYVQWGGRKIRDILYQFYNDKFMGTELTMFARHMFPVGTTCTRIVFAPEPYGLIYCVRSDGVLCVCAYIPEQQMVAWSRYVTAGNFEDVCVVPENGSFSVYVIVGRIIGGTYKRYIERFAQREYATLYDAFFVDSGLTYDGRNTSTTTMTLSGGTTWLAQDTGTLTASSTSGWTGFAPSDPTLNNAIWLYLTLTFTGSVGGSTSGVLATALAPGLYAVLFLNGESRMVTVALDGLTCTWNQKLAAGFIPSGVIRSRTQITAVTSSTVASVKFLDPIPAGLHNVATSIWTFARTTFSGLSNLIGATVAVFADGGTMPQQVVAAGGTLTLPSAGGVVHAGLPYLCQVESLSPNAQNGPPIRNRTKAIPRLSVVVDASAPFQAGPDFGNLTPAELREFEDYGFPTQLKTGVVHVPLNTEMEDDATICLQESDPVPLTVLSWFADTNVGEAP